MQSMALIDSSSPIPASTLYVDGDLRMAQRTLLDYGVDSIVYDLPVVNYSLALQGADSRALEWERVLSDYMNRDGEFFCF
jgi:hypothetical protein